MTEVYDTLEFKKKSLMKPILSKRNFHYKMEYSEVYLHPLWNNFLVRVILFSENMSLDKFLRLSGKRKAMEELSENNSAKMQKTNSKPTISRDKWQPKWDRTFPWAEKIETNGQLRAICVWCRDCKKTNSMATCGSPNLQGSTFVKHEATKDHIVAAEAHTAKNRRVTIVQTFEAQEERELESECDSTKEALFNTMYYIANEGQALNQYPRILALQIKNKCPDLLDSKKLYSSEEAKTEILDAINDTLEEKVDSDISNSEFIGLIIDESTDVTIHKKLNVYVKCLSEKSESVIHFVDCINVVDGKAETIVSEIVKLFQRKGIPLTKLMTLASDGASVMTGRHNGVGVRLQREHSPLMMQVHCVAHKLALAAGQACKDNSLFSEYQQTLKNVYRYFANSAVRYNELRAMMDIMNDENIEYLTLKEPARFRWLSLDGAVRAIADCYPALYSTLEHMAAKGNSEAKGLFNKVKCVTFVLVTGFLRDVLSVVTKLSTVFQRDLLDIETVNVMVEATVTKLNQLKNKNGPELSKVYEDMMTTKSMYRGVKLTDREQLRMQFQNNATDYLQKLLQNIEDRFDKSSMKNLQLLTSVLSPSQVLKNMNSLETHFKLC